MYKLPFNYTKMIHNKCNKVRRYSTSVRKVHQQSKNIVIRNLQVLKWCLIKITPQSTTIKGWTIWSEQLFLNLSRTDLKFSKKHVHSCINSSTFLLNCKVIPIITGYNVSQINFLRNSGKPRPINIKWWHLNIFQGSRENCHASRLLHIYEHTMRGEVFHTNINQPLQCNRRCCY